MPLDVQRRLLEGSVHALVCIRMPDRRHASPRDETWLLQHQVEAALFGDNCTGAMYRLLARESLSLSPMPLKRKSVQDGLVLDAEYTQLSLRAYAADSLTWPSHLQTVRECELLGQGL